MTIARGYIQGYILLENFLAQGIDIIHLVSQLTEISSPVLHVAIPVIG